MSNEHKPDKGVEIIASETLNVGEKIKVETAEITTETTTGIVKTITFDIRTASEDIVRKAIAANNVGLIPVQIEIVTETVERSKWLGGGVKLSFDFPGYGKFEFDRKPTKETKTITKEIYKAPGKK